MSTKLLSKVSSDTSILRIGWNPLSLSSLAQDGELKAGFSTMSLQVVYSMIRGTLTKTLVVVVLLHQPAAIDHVSRVTPDDAI
jgi:hypothetical protein